MSILIGTPHTHNAGYHMNDDRNSGGKKTEFDIQTCPHCQAVIDMQVWAKASVQNFCIKCMAPACNRDECLDCVPFIKKLEAFCNAMVKWQQHLKIAGLDPVAPPSIIITGKLEE